MKKNAILYVVILVLAVVVGMLTYERMQKPQTPMERMQATIERTADDVKDAAEDAAEEIKDEIDDHTKSR